MLKTQICVTRPQCGKQFSLVPFWGGAGGGGGGGPCEKRLLGSAIRLETDV